MAVQEPPSTDEEIVTELRQRLGGIRDSLRDRGAVWEGAWSVDGQTFSFEVGVSRPLPLGGYVEMGTPDGRRYIGQVIEESVVIREGPTVEVDLATFGAALGTTNITIELRVARGQGRLLTAVTDDGYEGVTARDTFDSATIEVAAPERVDAYLRASLGTATGLASATPVYGSDDPVPLVRAKGFNRHTFLCGQSGSGKTYALGVLLERLLFETTLPMVILDPNSDYVGLGDLLDRQHAGVHDDAEYAAVRDHWASIRDRIAVVGGETGIPLQVRFSRMPFESRARVLGLDPLRDAAEYDVFRRLSEDAPDEETVGQLAERAVATLEDAARRLALRIRNLRIDTWDLWAPPGRPALIEMLPDDWRVAAFDLGKLDSGLQRTVVAGGILEWFWERRYDRTPRLVVIDEAHNVCPHHPADDVQASTTETVIRIAAEGRKYGLYLLLSTQQPDKIHPNVLSQCDNLMLLRMNSTVDIARLADVFSFVPPALLGRAATFRLGEGLLAGRIAPHPVLIRGAQRWTREGGADIPTTWAQPQRRPQG